LLAPHLTYVLFFFSDPPTPELSTLSLHDALPICFDAENPRERRNKKIHSEVGVDCCTNLIERVGIWRPRRSEHIHARHVVRIVQDRKSTRLNSSHSQISYAVFCLKKKKK